MVNEILFKLISKNDIGGYVERDEAIDIINNGGSILYEDSIVFFKFNGVLKRLIADEIRNKINFQFQMERNQRRVLPVTGKQLQQCYDNKPNGRDYWDFRYTEDHAVKSERLRYSQEVVGNIEY